MYQVHKGGRSPYLGKSGIFARNHPKWALHTHPNESWTHNLTLQPIIIGEGYASWGIAHWQNYIIVLLVKLASYE